MSKNQYLLLSAFFISVLIIIISCSPDSCFEDTEATVKASMYDNTADKLIAPDSITLYGSDLGSDTIYNKKTNVVKVLFPLNPVAESCSFIIRINGITDTITFEYTSYPHLISKACGYTYYFTIQKPKTTSNIIKKVTLTKNTITTMNEENIRIYY
jgi:hypothetical protein